MKILVVGNGGREHALAWKLLQSAKIEQVICTPGNGGTATMERCQNLPIEVHNFEAIKQCVQDNNISFVVVGPEVPLAMGITDYLQHHNIPVFGPNQAGAQIEASKAWAKALMEEAAIPTAQAKVFVDEQEAEAIAYLRDRGAPIVIKADGLAAGKGVIVAQSVETAEAAIASILAGEFGVAGHCVVVEDCLVGQEVSVLALTDGHTIRPLLPAQDHKAIGEGDTGPKTGGMGVYAPAPLVTPELMERIQTEVLDRAIATLQKRGIAYRGILYAGLMVAPDGTMNVLEFNCRFGDPETQAILPLLETPLEDLMLACINQELNQQPPIRWKSGVSACVVMASGGYPGDYEKGKPITGLDSISETDAIIFHAGTELKAEQVLTSGGRVLGVTATGDNFDAAFAKAYAACDRIHFDNCYYRRDIGHRVRTPNPS